MSAGSRARALRIEQLLARSALCRQRMTGDLRALQVSLHLSSIVRLVSTSRILHRMVFRIALAVAGYGRITLFLKRAAKALLRLRAA